MISKQIHYQENRQVLLKIGNILFWGSILILSGLIILLSPSLNIKEHLSLIITILIKPIVPVFPILILFGSIILGLANTKIVTSSQGIELHQFGFCSKTNWNNVARIAPFQSGKKSIDAIYFHQPIRDFCKLVPSVSLTLVKMIPIASFRYDENSSLGQALRMYKPDLF